MQTDFTADQVTIQELGPVRVAVFEHRGDRRDIEATITRLIEWRKASGLSPKTNPTFNIWHSERNPANPADFSMDLCVALGPDQPFETLGEAVREDVIPGGRCASLRVTGDTHNLEPATLYLKGEWLPQSGEEMRDHPVYSQRFFLGELDEGQTAEVYLPLK